MTLFLEGTLKKIRLKTLREVKEGKRDPTTFALIRKSKKPKKGLGIFFN